MKKHIALFLLLVLLMSPSLCMAQESNQVYDTYYRVIYNHILNTNSSLSQEWAEWIAKTILYFCAQYGVDPLLATALFTQESGFNPNAYSRTGAISFAQLEPDTARAIGVDPYDPTQNIQGGIIYLRNQLDNFRNAGIWANDYAIAAYNCGPARIREYNGIPPYPETINHVIRVGQIYTMLARQM